MATVTITAALFLGAAAPTAARSTPAQRKLVVTNAAPANSDEVVKTNTGSKNMRRDVMFAAAAAAMCSVAGVALADEPRRGTAEAKRAYAPVCVTMPTARICRN